MSLVAIPFSATLSANETATLVLAKAATGRTIRYVKCALNGDSNVQTDKPIRVDIVTGDGTTAGTKTAASPVYSKASNTATPTATADQDFTVEPTVLTVRGRFAFHPSGGAEHFATDSRDEIESGVALHLGLRAVNPSTNGTIAVTGVLWIEE